MSQEISNQSDSSQVAMTREADTRCPDCADKDDDCAEVVDKAKCWTYAPERGMCSYLRSAPIGDTE